MTFSFWSNEDHLFVSRRIGFGWSINFKYIARKLDLIKDSPRLSSEDKPKSEAFSNSQQDLLRAQIEASKYEEKRH